MLVTSQHHRPFTNSLASSALRHSLCALLQCDCDFGWISVLLVSVVYFVQPQENILFKRATLAAACLAFELYHCSLFDITLKQEEWAVCKVWGLTHLSSHWKESPSASWEAPSITSACPEPTGGTVCWRWKPVVSTHSRRRLPLRQHHRASAALLSHERAKCRLNLN